MVLRSKKKIRRKKLPSMKSLRRKAWDIFSVWVRSSTADFSGYQECYTCGRSFQWKTLHAGHFVHGSHDFDPMNVKPQCTGCNTYGHGKELNYYLHLVKEYGRLRADELRSRPHWNAYNRTELMRVIETYS